MGLRKGFMRLFSRKTDPPRPPIRPMLSFDAIDPGRLPKKQINAFIADINQLINTYNGTDDVPSKRGFLNQIQKKINEIDYKFPPSYFAASPGYQSIHASLFKETQYQLASMGISSVRDNPLEPSSLPEIIANMSPEKADDLLKILHKGATAKLREELPRLYTAEDTSAEAANFRFFLKNHTISFLGGGNSKNFKVTERLSGTSSVLKVDCRLNMPRNVEAYLRNRDALQAKFTPIEAERQVSCKIETGEIVSRTLLVTSFCAEGSVLDQRDRLMSVGQLKESTSKIFEQMATIFLDLQEANTIFPDAKITNWLVDETGTLRLADTKSFLFTDSNGDYDPSVPGNEYCGFIQTKGYNPPKIYEGSINADSAHAFILGKNLHQYASGKLGEGDDAAKYDFNGQIFKTEIGPQLETLIKSLVKPNPSERLSVKDAKDELFMINNPTFRETFSDLKALKVGTNDPAMDTYIREKQQAVNQANPEEKTKILSEMKTMAHNLKSDPATKELTTIINNYRKNSGWFTIGMNAKATRIEQALSKVPLEDRKNLLASKKTQGVMEALASHRYFGKRGNVYLDKDGAIDPEKAATTFKSYKEKFKIQTEHLKILSKPEEETLQKASPKPK